MENKDYEYMGNRFVQSIMDTGWILSSEEQNLLFDRYIQSLKEEEAVIYRIYRNPKTGKTSSSEAYFKKDLDHLMLNTLATSPLFGLEDARVSEKAENVDTSESYIQSKIRERVDEELKRQKQEGKEFLTDAEIDSLIDQIIKEEIEKKK